MGAEVQTADKGLKRLGFVKGYSGYVYSRSLDLSSSLYSKTTSFVPGSLKPSLKRIEDLASDYAGPVFHSVQDSSSKALTYADGQVDKTILSADSIYTSKIQPALENKWYVESRDLCLKKAEETVNFVKERGVTGTAKSATEGLLAAVQEAKEKIPSPGKAYSEVISRVESAWESFVTHPQVQAIFNSAQSVAHPPVDFAWKKYLAVHDAVVATPVYHKAFQIAAGALDGLQSGVLYKSAKDKFYPVISPIADPTFEKITHSAYYSELLEHLKPITASEKHAAHAAT